MFNTMNGIVLNGRYKIIRVLGAGGFGQTYLADDIQRPEISPCVVKQFQPASTDTKFLKVARRLFDTEVDVLARLGKHPQIPSFYDSFEENFEFYLVQEFVDGTPLADELDQVESLDEPQVIDLIRDVLNILNFVHSQRVIHRDIKPENLIRRNSDDKFVLIDFGAVKEIQTQIVDESGQTRLTVGIGTEGYTPSEQLGGKPRYSSDIYALGITAIQSLTGLQPYQLGEDLKTGEIIWRDRAVSSIGLSLILDRMVRFHFSNRYQSADEVIDALDKLSNLPTDLTSIPDSQIYETLGIEDSHPGDRSSSFDTSRRQKLIGGLKSVAIATVAVSGLVFGIRQLGWLQRFELVAYDRMVQLSADRVPDPRIVLVGITEDDLRELQRGTPSDQSIADAIQQLQKHNPKVIGLDLYRDIPQLPGHDALLKELDAPNVITIMNLGSSTSTSIPAPPGVPPERVGFNDFPIDADGVVRRNLLLGTTENEQVYHSFALQLVRPYLASFDIQLSNDPNNPQQIQLGNVPIPRLKPNSGGYQNEDAAGYQIMLDYRTQSHQNHSVSLMEAIRGEFDPAIIEDNIVMIGTVAQSSRDFFETPFSAGRSTEFKMAGVVVHSQMTSQLLDIALHERSVIQFLPEWGEFVWIIVCSITGGTIALFLRHPITLAISSMIFVLGISGISIFMMSQQVWIPVVAPAIAALLSGGLVITYRSYTAQKKHDAVTQFLKENR